MNAHTDHQKPNLRQRFTCI